MTDVTGFRVVPGPAHAILAVTGPLDNISAAPFEQLVERCLGAGESIADIVVDLDATPYVTAAGIGALLHALARAADAGCRLHVEHARPLVASTFAVLGLDTVLCPQLPSRGLTV